MYVLSQYFNEQLLLKSYTKNKNKVVTELTLRGAIEKSPIDIAILEKLIMIKIKDYCC